MLVSCSLGVVKACGDIGRDRQMPDGQSPTSSRAKDVRSIFAVTPSLGSDKSRSPRDPSRLRLSIVECKANARPSQTEYRSRSGSG